MIPDKIKVGSSTFWVKEAPEISNTEDLWGRIVYDSRTIYVKEGMCAEQRVQTLMHEVVHAIHREISSDANEGDIDRMARMLIQVIKDNPELVKAIRSAR